MMLKLTDAQKSALLWLWNRGKSGYIDRYGRVVANGEVYPAGQSPVWLALVSKGLLSGNYDRLNVTPPGVTVAEMLSEFMKKGIHG